MGASCIAITLGMYGAEVMTLTVSGGLGLIPVGGTVVTLPQLAGAFQLVTGTVTSQNLLFQMEEVRMFCASGKEMARAGLYAPASGMQLQHEVAQCYLSWESTLRGRHGREATRTRHADEAIYGK